MLLAVSTIIHDFLMTDLDYGRNLEEVNSRAGRPSPE